MKLRSHVEPAALLREWRKGINLSQPAMADLMGVPLRTYEDLEKGRSTVRPIHLNAAVLALIEHAADHRGVLDLPADIVELVQRAARSQ